MKEIGTQNLSSLLCLSFGLFLLVPSFVVNAGEVTYELEPRRDFVEGVSCQEIEQHVLDSVGEYGNIGGGRLRGNVYTTGFALGRERLGGKGRYLGEIYPYFIDLNNDSEFEVLLVLDAPKKVLPSKTSVYILGSVSKKTAEEIVSPPYRNKTYTDFREKINKEIAWKYYGRPESIEPVSIPASDYLFGVGSQPLILVTRLLVIDKRPMLFLFDYMSSQIAVISPQVLFGKKVSAVCNFVYESEYYFK